MSLLDYLSEDFGAKKEGGGIFFKPAKGKNQLRVVADKDGQTILKGYRYLQDQGDGSTKFKFLREMPETMPIDTAINKHSGKIEPPKYCCVLVVIDRKENSLKIWECYQGSIHSEMKKMVKHALNTLPEEMEHLAGPEHYDMVVERIGDGLDTKYSVDKCRAEPLSGADNALISEYVIDLSAVYDPDRYVLQKAENAQASAVQTIATAPTAAPAQPAPEPIDFAIKLRQRLEQGPSAGKAIADLIVQVEEYGIQQQAKLDELAPSYNQSSGLDLLESIVAPFRDSDFPTATAAAVEDGDEDDIPF